MIWVQRLEQAAYGACYLLDEINYESVRCKVQRRNQNRKMFPLSFTLSNRVTFRWKLARKIKKFNKNFNAINEQANSLGLQYLVAAPPVVSLLVRQETDAHITNRVIVGREDEVTSLVQKVKSLVNDENISVISVVGMGGIGKTTFARLVYNDQRLDGHFDKKIWICVSNGFESLRLLRLMLEQLIEQDIRLENRQTIVKRLHEKLKGKRCVLVLDDVWYDEPNQNDSMTWDERWNDFKSSFEGINSINGSCIIVTTRNQDVASVIASKITVPLAKLSDRACWQILEEKASSLTDAAVDFDDEMRMEIARKCQGLPLAAKVLGGMLRTKETVEWLPILEKGLSGVDGDKNSILRILKLSYDHLPDSSLKNCFAFCSTFGKDTVMEVKELVQLWMANGFLQASIGNYTEMEDRGNICFSILLKNSLLEIAEVDDCNHIISCKMHDLVHDLSDTILRSQQRAALRWLVIDSFDDEKLRSVIDHESSTTTLSLINLFGSDVLLNVKLLHILKLSGSKVKELPFSIGKLIHLRYLDTSRTPIKRLPNSVCKLFNLETIRLEKCASLPTDFKDLISLRHIHFASLESMPLELGKLTSLRTLELFIISQEKGRRVEELGGLKNLQGSLTINNLELVNGKEGAWLANLCGKPNLEKLTYTWSNRGSVNINDDKEVLEGLQPPPKLKSITIENFMGVHFAPWLLNMCVIANSGEVLRLNNIMVMRLINCRNCEELPTLGQLPHLKLLELKSFHNVTEIGHSFYDTMSSKSKDVLVQRKVFPSLERLFIEDMPNLKDWADPLISDVVEDRVRTMFPCLKELNVISCSNLRSIPSNFPSLEQLKMEGITSSIPLDMICSRELTAVTNIYIGDIQDLTCLTKGMFSNKKNLLYLELCGCPNLAQFSLPNMFAAGSCLRELYITDCETLNELDINLFGLQTLEILSIWFCHGLKTIRIPHKKRVCLPSLHTLKFSCCDGLISLPSKLLESCETLHTLWVYKCDNLISFPVDLCNVPSLSFLGIYGCPKLNSMPCGGFGHLTRLRELWFGPFSDAIEFGSIQASMDGIQQLSSSLDRLMLSGWPHWKYLPDQIQHLTGLTDLHVAQFGVEALPDWLGNLSSLDVLWLDGCKELSLLPPVGAMRCLTQLRELHIVDCPLLGASCSPESQGQPDSQWKKICHLPTIKIDWVDAQRSSNLEASCS